MTDQGTVDGGLDEPEELEPEQGSLALADAEDRSSREDWEKSAAAVLRKTGRLRDGDSDAEVWDRLALRTLDGIAVSPLGTPQLVEDLATSGRPDRAGDWDIRAHLSGSDAKQANEAALVDLDNGVTSLWLQGTPDTDLAAVLEGVLLDLAPVVLDGIAPDAFLTYADGRTLHPATNLGTAAGDATGEAAQQALDAGVLGFVVDAARVHDRGASDVQELAWSLATGAAYLRTLVDGRRRPRRRSPAAGVPLRRHRRAVPDHRQAPRRPPPVGARARAERGHRAGPAPARGHQPGDDEQVRPLGQHAPHHRRRVRRGRRGSGRGHRAAVRLHPRRAGRLRSPDRPQHLQPADLRVPPGPGRRPGRRCLRRREAHRRPGPHRVGALREARGGGGSRRADRGDGGRAASSRWPPASARSPDSPSSRTPSRTCPSGAPAHDSREVRRYGAAFEALQDAPTNEPVFLATMGTVAQHTARATFATNLFAAGRRTRRGSRVRPMVSSRCSGRTTANRWCASQARTRPTTSGVPRQRRPFATRARRGHRRGQAS